MSVTALQAIANYNANHSLVAQVVVDNSANMIISLAGLQTLKTARKLASTTVTGTANTVTATQATSLAALTGFMVGGEATLVVADSAANLLLVGNSTGVVKGSSVQVTGTSNTVTAAQAKTLAGKPNFALASGARLVVADGAANLLLVGNATGVAIGTSVQVTGTSNTVTAAQAATLAGKPNFALASGATLVVADGTANLLLAGNAAGVAKGTTVQVTGTSNTVTAAQATTLAGKPHFALASGASLVVADSAANLLLVGNATGVAKATTVQIIGISNTVTAAQATTLAGKSNFALTSGSTLVVADSAANLLLAGNVSAPASGMTFRITGTSNSVTAAQATMLAGKPNFGLASGATLIVADTAINLLSTSYASGLAKATTVHLTGTANSVTAAQGLILVALPYFGLASGASLSIAGANTVSAAQATTLASVKGCTLTSGATLVVADGAANLLFADNATGVAKGTTVQVTGTSNTVTAAQATTLAGKPNFALASGATLVVADGTANLLLANNATGVAKGTTVQVTGTSNIVTAAQATTLVSKPNFALASGATLVVADGAANLLLAGNATGVAKATSVQVTGTSNTVTAAQATTLAALPNFALASGATLLVIDSAANLLLVGNAPGIAKGTMIEVAGTANTVTAAQAANLAGKPSIVWSPDATFQVIDTADNVVRNIDAIQILSNSAALTSINLTDSTGLTLAASMIAIDAAALGQISGSFTLTPTGTLSAAGAAGLPSGLISKLTSGLDVSDTASNVASNATGLVKLNTAGKLASIAVSGTLSARTAAGLSSLLVAKLTSGLAVSDTASNIAASASGLVTLNTAGKLTSITATGTLGAAAAAGLPGSVVAKLVSGLAVSDTAANIATYAAGLVSLNAAGELASITATGPIGATAAAGLPASLFASLTVGLAVSDTALNIGINIDALQALAGASKLVSVAFTDGGTPSLSITYTQYTADTVVLGKLGSNIRLFVSAAPVSAAATLQTDSRVGGFSVADTMGNVAASFDALSSDPNLTAITLTDGGPLAITAAQYLKDAAAIAKIATSAMKINITWDASVANAPSQFKQTILAAINFLDGYFSNQIIININVGFGEVGGVSLGSNALGQSNTYLVNMPYNVMVGAVANAADTATDASVLAALPATAPIAGATYWTTTAQAKALGLISSTNASTDGSIGFSSRLPFSYGNVTAVASGTYNLYAVVLHEITEVMGRQLLTGVTLGGAPKSFSLMDMLHYSAPGVLAFTQATPGYLSSDGGVTSLGAVNTISGADAGDWSSAVPNNAFDAFASSGVGNTITSNDMTLLDAIGYNPDIGLIVSAASVADAATLQADSRVTAFAISDTASAVQAALDTLNSDSKLNSISFTDTGTPTLSMTYGHYASEAVGFVLAPIGSPQPMGAWIPLTSKFVGSYRLIVSGVPAWAAPLLQADSRVTSFSVIDTPPNIQAGIDALNGCSRLSSISFTGTDTPSLSFSYAQYTSNTAAIGKITGKCDLVLSGAPVSAAAALQADSQVTSFSVADSNATGWLNGVTTIY